MRRAFPTSEGQDLVLRLAGPGCRTSALLIDLIVLIGLFLVLLVGLVSLSVVIGDEAAATLATLLAMGMVFPIVLQGSVMAMLGRESIGKRTVGLQVLDASGVPATPGQHFVRGVALLAECIPVPFPLGFLVAFMHPEGRRLGDLLAGTFVVYVETGTEPQPKRRRRRTRKRKVDLAAPEQGVELGFELTPASLSRIGRSERWLLLELSQRGGLRAGVQDDLIERLAELLRRRMRLPDFGPDDSRAHFLGAVWKRLERSDAHDPRA